MKNKETLEDYVLDSDEHNNLKSDDDTYLNFHRQSELLLKGAKLGSEWQQEQNKKLYSEEDLREAFRQGEQNISYSETYGLDSELTEQQWFEQFSKLKNG